MFVEFALTCSMALLLVYLFIPSLWMSIISSDDERELNFALVASRNPFRDDQVACMAKLIMLRHRIQTRGKKRRTSPQPRSVPRPYNLSPPRSKAPWIRFGRPFGMNQSH